MDTTTDLAEAEAFLTAVFGPNRPPANGTGTEVVFTRLDPRKTEPPDLHRAPLGDLPTAADLAAHAALGDVYVNACGMAPGQLRGTADTATLFPGAWADVDVGKPGAAPTKADALAFLNNLADPPTLVIDSGGGLQAWWLLHTPVPIGTDRHRYRHLVEGVRDRLQAESGWKLDNVSDLSRMMRVPGTLNHKHTPPAPTRLLVRDGPRYALAKLEDSFPPPAVYAAPSAPAAPTATWEGPGAGTEEALAILRRRVEAMEHAPPSESNAVLSSAAFTLGGLAAAGELDEEPALQSLLAAAVRRIKDQDAGDIERRIRHQWAAGAEAPWSAEADWIVEVLVGDEWVQQTPAPAQEPAPPKYEKKKGLRVYTADGLDSIPDPEWLIEGILVKNTIATLYGPPGAGKSFLALDWTFTVGTGLPAWQGHATAQAPVLYVAAEGVYGIKKRRRAWQVHNNKQVASEVSFVAGAVNLFERGEDFGELLALVAKQRPGLIVVDTLARSAVGAEENSAKDMGKFIEGMERLREMSGACVLVVHHSRKDGGGIRGSSALPGAFDTEVELASTGRVKCIKQKDAPPFHQFTLALHEVPDTDSCVLVPQNEADAPVATHRADIFHAVSDLTAAGEPASTSQILSALDSIGVDISRSTLTRNVRTMLDAGDLRVAPESTKNRPLFLPHPDSKIGAL